MRSLLLGTYKSGKYISRSLSMAQSSTNSSPAMSRPPAISCSYISPNSSFFSSVTAWFRIFW